MVKSPSTPHKLVLWGHSLADYKEMFALSDADLHQALFDCYPGAASFNAQLTQLQGQVVSCDSLYSQPVDTLKKYLQDLSSQMLARVTKHQERFVWDKIKSLTDLSKTRQAGMDTFLADYPQGKKEQRYIAEDITATSFDSGAFGLALCSHFLFGYREDYDLDQHLAILSELIRIAREVRIFPLLDSKGDISPLVGPILLALQQKNLGVEVREVPYQLQANGNAMMRIWAQHCDL